MPLYKANGIVLRRTNLGETDRILTLLTREAGKLSAVAKGARRGTSRLSGATELFTHSRLLMATGRSLDVISQCEIRESFPALRTDLHLLARATYLCEVADRLTEEREPSPDVFDLLLSALYLLQRVPERPDIIVHAFELRLLEERGYAPVLDRCIRCQGPLDRQRCGFSPSLGGALCTADRFASQDAVPAARDTLHLMARLLTASASEMVLLQPPAQQMRETARCLKWYVRYRVERDLKSAELVERLRVTPEPPAPGAPGKPSVSQ